MKKIIIGLLAHVDAGKTTLSEAMLYTSGELKKQGRVDHGDAFLDTHKVEKDRGITVFSKQAVFSYESTEFTIVDTPGHMDFSTEMERTLSVLDYAVIVISGSAGIQPHTEVIWELLQRHDIPAFIFITKMDLDTSHRNLSAALADRLSIGCIPFSDGIPLNMEEAALCNESSLEEYLESGTLSESTISRLVKSRKLFPVFSGSGLTCEGVKGFLSALDRYAIEPEPNASFGAKIYKIMRDPQGIRMTFLRVTGGSIKVRSALEIPAPDGIKSEKVIQIRKYSGVKFVSCDEAIPGSIYAICGLETSLPGMSLGEETGFSHIMEPVMKYGILLPGGVSPREVYPSLRQLSEEDPQLSIQWDDLHQEITVQIMGPVQIDVLRQIIDERFGIHVEFSSGSILYKESIIKKVEGVGHYEPLRHYAEVHLLLSPAPRGSGLIFKSNCREDELDRNWQNLILTHLEEKQHLGVLTGSPITDMEISLIAGRAHEKHTEGGDFRQATYRALRQGLMSAHSILLEPQYTFRLKVPSEQLGRALSDIRARKGRVDHTESGIEYCLISGSVPVSKFMDYPLEVASYTHGRGSISCWPGGYAECSEQDKVIEEIGYDAKKDMDNPSDSVFCAHGAGFNVSWDHVKDYAHIDTGFGRTKEPSENLLRPVIRSLNLDIDEKEIEEIMQREFGPIKRPAYVSRSESGEAGSKPPSPKPVYLIIDGYNIIYGWDDLKKQAETDLGLARETLIKTMENYKAVTGSEIVVVFDAYRVVDGAGSREDHNGVHVVYTKHKESADSYIEKFADGIGKNYSVRVITSDAMVQLSALGSGVLRISTREFRLEVDWILKKLGKDIEQINNSVRKEKVGDKIKNVNK